MRKTLFPILLTTLALVGCDLFNKDGKLDLKLTDAPYTDAARVVVTIRSVRLQSADGDREDFDLDPVQQVDLLQFRDGDSFLLLSGAALPSGDYTSIRLRLDDGSNNNYVEGLNGGIYALDVPDDELALSSDFSIDDHGTTKLTLDVDLRRSLRASSGGDRYRMVPSLRLVNDDDVGTISGTVRGDLLDDGCVPAIYVYQGKVTPDDIGGTGAQPYSSSNVIASNDGGYRYTAAFLPEATYSLALTCEADQDGPAQDDDIRFGTVAHVDVRKGRTATQNF